MVFSETFMIRAASRTVSCMQVRWFEFPGPLLDRRGHGMTNVLFCQTRFRNETCGKGNKQGGRNTKEKKTRKKGSVGQENPFKARPPFYESSCSVKRERTVAAPVSL